MPYKDKDKQKKQKRKAHLLSAYGLSTDQYNKMFVDQQGKCDLCGIHQKELNHALCVDHCHVTANIRGLLCKKCNAGLGHFKDDPDLFIKASNYLKGIK